MKYNVMMTPALVVGEEVRSNRSHPGHFRDRFVDHDGSATMSAGDCGCSGGQTLLVVACSGASNLGHNHEFLGSSVDSRRREEMTCLAGVGAHIPGFVVSAKDSERLVVLDGSTNYAHTR